MLGMVVSLKGRRIRLPAPYKTHKSKHDTLKNDLQQRLPAKKKLAS